MRKMLLKEIVAYVDSVNINDFKYVGVLFPKSGYRVAVERARDIINQLGKPVEEIEVQSKPPNIPQQIAKNIMYLNFDSDYVNIYEVSAVKDKLEKWIYRGGHHLSKKRCMVMLRYIGEDV